ncbi:sec-independent protein translocase protein TATB, chloroplastic isoform X5 [Lycium ferocissimum]|uniref:sec-independent protein translocase protein TATB, chloroplastic isoform X5 n=1 Tax=Lycium ferocissimum TaxID=112874 RepID=UPI002816997F|nr:sec-independent protein translocase protein TATB, chloroplastic isoform X5 [Lycium ferocissimum]
MTTMASAISAPTASSSFTSSRRLSLTAFSTSSISVSKNPKVHFLKCLGLTPFSWNGLKQLSISKSQYSVLIGRSRKLKGKGVYASLFGVGAPEALVIGVVALLVFGPKGLAEVARNLGKTLREFQPTIRELQDVSREFKSTLEREIGLDDIKGSVQDTKKSSTMSPSSDTSSKDSTQVADPNNSSSSDGAYSTEELLKITEEQLQAAAQQQNETSTPEQSQFNAQSPSQDISSAEGAYSTEELSNNTETTSPQQSPSNVQSQSQETPEEAASMIPSSTKPESET